MKIEKAVIALLIVWLCTKLLYSKGISIDAFTATVLQSEFHAIDFSDSSYSRTGGGFTLGAQIAWRELVYSFSPYLHVIYQPLETVDSETVGKAPRLRYRMSILTIGINKTFTLGRAKLDFTASAGKSWQTFYGHHREGVASVSDNAPVLMVGGKIRSYISNHIYMFFDLEYFYKKNKSFSGTVNTLSYELNTHHPIGFIIFGFGIEF
jgi:hypothetical protein